MKALAYYDGKIGAPEELTVPFYDRAHFFGDGCYDAAMAAGGTIFLLEDHLDRFYASARLLDIHIPMEKQALGELLTQLARQVEGESCFVYWQVSRGVEPRSHTYAENLPGKLWVLVRPQVIPNPNIPIRLNDEEDTRFFHCNIKSLNLLCNVMTAQRAHRAGCTETVFHRGEIVTECAHSNISVLKDGVLPKMQEILQKDRELTELVEDIRSADAGTVRLGAFTSVAVHWLPGMIRTFQSAHPKAELKMFNGDYHDMEQWLREGEVDLGFVTLPAPEGMRTIPLTQDPLVAIMPKNHRLAQLDEIPIQELGEDPFISLLQSSAHDIHRALDNAGVRPNIKFTTKDDYAILAMVEQGLGISIVPQLLIQGRTQNLAVRPLKPRASRTIALAIPEGKPLPVVEAFARTAVDWVNGQSGK